MTPPSMLKKKQLINRTNSIVIQIILTTKNFFDTVFLVVYVNVIEKVNEVQKSLYKSGKAELKICQLEWQLRDLGPVSYTHLDVYKRQIQNYKYL